MPDLIEREKAITEIQKWWAEFHIPTIYVAELEQRFNDMPPADTEQCGTAHWVGIYGITSKNYKCSECGRRIKLKSNETLLDYPYCHCGRAMTECTTFTTKRIG